MVRKMKRIAGVPVAKALILAAVATTYATVHGAAVASNSSSVSNSTLPIGGMVAHQLESQDATKTTAGHPVVTAPMFKNNGKAASASSAASIVSSMLAVNGSSNPDLVSQAVSEAEATATPPTDSADQRKAVSPTSSSKANDRQQKKKAAAKSTAAASSSAPAKSAADSSQTTWYYDSGAFGCAQGKPSGTAYICQGTGKPVAANQRRAMPTNAAAAPFDKRQSSSTDNQSGNGGPPPDVINKDSPEVSWLSLMVGSVPYKNGDLAPSIVWILASLFLIPFFLIRILRRSSLVAHVLVTTFIWIALMVATFAIRAYMANGNVTTTLMIAENIMLQILPCLLLEPLINLLSLYAQQGGFPTGVPKVALFLRFLNLVALIIYVTAAGFLGNWLSHWQRALNNPFAIDDRSSFPVTDPISFVRIAPIVAAFIQIVCVIGALLLIPIARGENGSMRPGGFIAVLVLLVTLPIVYRVLQTLQAQSEFSDGSTSDVFRNLAADSASTMSSAAFNAVLDLVPIAQVAPEGMWSPTVEGIDWDQLQRTLASRGKLQSPLVFNLVYIFPQWLQTFLFFFIHAPGNTGDGKLAPASQQP